MSDNPKFIDRTGYEYPEKLDLWEPVTITKEEIDEEIARLAAQPRPENGRRQSLIVHPRWQELGVGPGDEPGHRNAVRGRGLYVCVCVLRYLFPPRAGHDCQTG